MDFWLNDEQKMLRYNVREFAEKEIGPLAQELDEKEEFSYELTKKMADLGLFGIYVPEEYGGDAPFVPVSAKTVSPRLLLPSTRVAASSVAKGGVSP